MKKGIVILVLIGMKGILLSQVDYDTEVQPIFNSNCTGCHGNSGGLNLTSYSNLMAGTSNHGPVVTVYDILGKWVRTLVQRFEKPSLKSVIWDGRDDFGRPVSSGEYLYQISKRSEHGYSLF